MTHISEQPNSWLSSSLESRNLDEKGGHGVFCVSPVRKGELLIVWGGTIVNRDQFNELDPLRQMLSVQVEEGLYLISTVFGPGDHINHCCNPNAGLRGQIAVVALRDIEPGEEICFDYAMSDASDYDEFECACGASNCRGRITGNDWRKPELWERYEGYFSPYVQSRIDRLRAEMGE